MDISSVVSFLTDNSKKVSSKALFVIFGILLIFIIDNSLSFSYYHNISKKTESLKNISEILNDSLLSKSERKSLIDLRKSIVSHKTLKDKSYDYLTNFKFETDKLQITEKEQLIDRRDKNIHFISSSWWMLFVGGVFILIMPFIMFQKNTSTIEVFLGLIVIEAFLYVLSLILSKVFSYIPLIFNKPILNYILNFILSSIILWIIIKTSKKKENAQ